MAWPSSNRQWISQTTDVARLLMLRDYIADIQQQIDADTSSANGTTGHQPLLTLLDQSFKQLAILEKRVGLDSSAAVVRSGFTRGIATR